MQQCLFRKKKTPGYKKKEYFFKKVKKPSAFWFFGVIKTSSDVFLGQK
jgi:hypothetical protein